LTSRAPSCGVRRATLVDYEIQWTTWAKSLGIFLINTAKQYTIDGKSGEEAVEVAGVRGVVFQNRISNPVQRVIEPELDMDRLCRKQLHTVYRFRALMRKLVPTAHSAVCSPMRSIARELEEIWPSREL
jgi:hypothetical protein